VEHLSEILKILDGALKANASMASNYAGLLADKLEQDGSGRQARMIRERLARAPMALANAQDASGGVSYGSLPIDGESHLHTVDVSNPVVGETNLLLPSAIRQRVDEFLSNIRRYNDLAKAGAAMPSRLLTYGLPGTGKTRLARFVAAELGMPLLTVRCDTLVSSLLGQTSRNLRRVFEYSQQRPCVLFLDEFDALAAARGNERDVGELQRVVISLLQNIDSLSEETILVAATNHDQLLDPAIWRRFGFRVPMPIPDAGLRMLLWTQFLGPFLPPGMDLRDLVTASEGITGANIEQVCLDTKRTAVLSGDSEIDETHLYRRLGLALSLTSSVMLSTIEAEIQWLRDWDPKRFSLRSLSKQYGLSIRSISKILKEETSSGREEAVKRASRRKE
jgi:SpoVK/Ycf46/Vps4 family AAA+-type ATPase